MGRGTTKSSGRNSVKICLKSLTSAAIRVLRPPPPPADEITIVDEILILPNVCSNIQIRKVLHIRSLIRPLNGSYLYNWTRVAKLLHVDRGTVKRWHRKGLNEVVEKADRRKICYVKNYMDQSQML